MTSVLHVLPHRGGGAETYLDLLERLDGVEHRREALSSARTPLAAAPSILARWPRVARLATRADVVHAHGDVAAIIALPLLRSRPSVWTTHGLHMLRRAAGPAASAARAGARAAVRATAATLCCSAAERDELAALVPADLHARLLLAPNGVDVPADDRSGRAAMRAELGVGEGVVVALFLGALEERKDPMTAVLAARRAAEAGAPLVLLVAGDGPLSSAVAAQAGGSVRALGFRSDPDRLLLAADVLVLPSRREGLSFAVLEAMARGLALVVAEEPGTVEAVGDAGVVLPRGDVEAFASALDRLARDPAERERLGRAARRRVADRFAVDRTLDGVRAAYAAAVAPAPVKAPSRGAGDGLA